MKTKDQIQKYNKEYSSRPEVIAWAKIRNVRPERRLVRKLYKKSVKGKLAEEKYRMSHKKMINKRIWKRNLKIRYGITEDNYKELLKKQVGKCAICDKKEAILNIDHNHKTGRVRGLLCGSCNRALGLMKDNAEFLVKAIDYLKE